MSKIKTKNVSKAVFKNKTVGGFIQSFLNNKSLNSGNTSGGYETDIRQFFKATRYKDIEDLTMEDLIFTNDNIEEYKFSIAHELAPTTVARKISSVKSLIEN